MELTRRQFIKSSAITAAATAAGIDIPGALAQTRAPDGVRWDKGVCRFCGTGCGVLIGTRDGRVVATQGDPDAPVNKGLNCIKGYFLSKIQYGKDRLTQPLLRMKDGKFDKNGEFETITWKQLGTSLKSTNSLPQHSASRTICSRARVPSTAISRSAPELRRMVRRSS